MSVAKCDFCGVKSDSIVRTHFGSGFGYVRLVCPDCKKSLGAKSIAEEEDEKWHKVKK